MNLLKLTMLLSGVLLFSNSQLIAQNEAKPTQSFPISITVMDESVSIPNFWFVRYSYNPALMVGTEYILKEKGNHDWHLTANLGGYYSKEWQGAVFLNSELGYRYHLKRWNTSARFGLGYAHTFETQPIYKPVNGTFEQVSNYGNPALMTSLALNVSYKLKDEENSPEVFLNYMSSIEFPISLYGAVHQMVGVGVKFYPNW